MSIRKNAVYNMAYRVFSLLLPLVTAPYLSRVVGTEGVGLYDYAWNISYLFVLVGMLGLENYGVRAIARVRDDREELNRAFSEIWRMQLLVAGGTLLIWLGYVFLIAGEERPVALHLTLMSVSCLVNLDWCLMGLDQFRPIALRNTAVKLAGAAAIFLLVRSRDDLWLYALVWSLATLTGCLSCWTTLRGRVRLIRVSWRDALRHLPPCATLFISVIAVSVYRRMDVVMLGAMAGWEPNGLYTNAEKIIYCLSGFISAIGTVMLPQASALMHKGQVDKLKRRIALSMELMMCMTAALAFGLASVAERFAPLFFGADFAYSGTLMIPLAFTLITIGFANVIRTQWVLPGGHDAILIRSVVSGACVNLALNALFIPRIGAMGAVIGTLAAETAVPLVQWLHLRRELPYPSYVLSCAAYAVIGLVMLLAVRLIGSVLPLGGWTGLAVQVAIGAAVYIALTLLYWKITGKQEAISLLKRTKSRL
ncbi:MAG: oligosaccharide flippase family protein [Christensenellaceae bacterium]|nr:oligosaccharide flippase family protein [Christensenellaceae bacterium]